MDQQVSGRSTQSPPRAGRGIYLACVACAFAYAFYAWATFTGLYRWLAELEVERFGAYDIKMTFLALIFGLMIVPALLVVAPIHAYRRLRGLPAINITKPAPTPPRAANPRTERRVYLGIGAIGLVVFLVAGAIGYTKSQKVITFTPFDLNSGLAPPSTYVELAAVAVPRLQMKLEETSNGTTTTTPYIPLLPRGWKKGDPITYFLRPHFNYYTGAAGSHPMESDSPAFLIKQTGLLLRDDLPGLITAGFEKDGFKLGAPPIVLDTDTQADLMPYFGATFAGGIMVLMTPMLLIGARIKAARARKRAQAVSDTRMRKAARPS